MKIVKFQHFFSQPIKASNRLNGLRGVLCLGLQRRPQQTVIYGSLESKGHPRSCLISEEIEERRKTRQEPEWKNQVNPENN